MVPQPRGNAIAGIGVHVVMHEVVLPELLPGAVARRLVPVLGVVHGDVGEVAQHEAGEEHEDVGGAHQPEEQEEQAREEQARNGRHREPPRIHRMLVVDAVRIVLDPVQWPRVGLGVVQEAVDVVLGERPEEAARESDDDRRPPNDAERDDAVGEQRSTDEQMHHDRRLDAAAREGLHQPVAEQASPDFPARGQVLGHLDPPVAE